MAPEEPEKPAPEKGVLVGSGGFKVDRKAALEKLTSFQLAPEDLLVPWVRCAEACGASRFAAVNHGGVLTLSFDGEPFTHDELSSPFYALFEEADAPRRLGLLAAGLLGLDRLKPERWRLASGTGAGLAVLEGNSLEALKDGRNKADNPGTAVAVRLSMPGALQGDRALHGVRGRLLLGRADVTLNGELVGPEDFSGRPFALAGLEAVLAPAAGRAVSRVRLASDGVWAQSSERVTGWPPVETVLSGAGVSLDASRVRIVQDDAVAAALEAWPGLLPEFARGLARLQQEEAPRVRLFMLDPELWDEWGGRPDDQPRGKVRRDESAAFAAAARTRWLRAACRQTGWNDGGPQMTALLDELREAPAFMTAAGGWLTCRQLDEEKRARGFVFSAGRRDASFSFFTRRPPSGGREVTGRDVVWTPTKTDLDDLRAFLGDGAVEVLA